MCHGNQLWHWALIKLVSIFVFTLQSSVSPFKKVKMDSMCKSPDILQKHWGSDRDLVDQEGRWGGRRSGVEKDSHRQCRLLTEACQGHSSVIMHISLEGTWNSVMELDILYVPAHQPFHEINPSAHKSVFSFIFQLLSWPFHEQIFNAIERTQWEQLYRYVLLLFGTNSTVSH